jgi:hypothetical protein
MTPPGKLSHTGLPGPQVGSEDEHALNLPQHAGRAGRRQGGRAGLGGRGECAAYLQRAGASEEITEPEPHLSSPDPRRELLVGLLRARSQR